MKKFSRRLGLVLIKDALTKSLTSKGRLIILLSDGQHSLCPQTLAERWNLSRDLNYGQPRSARLTCHIDEVKRQSIKLSTLTAVIPKRNGQRQSIETTNRWNIATPVCPNQPAPIHRRAAYIPSFLRSGYVLWSVCVIPCHIQWSRARLPYIPISFPLCHRGCFTERFIWTFSRPSWTLLSNDA